MASPSFYLAGEDVEKARQIDISAADDLSALKNIVAAEFHIVEPNGSNDGPGYGKSECVVLIVCQESPSNYPTRNSTTSMKSRAQQLLLALQSMGIVSGIHQDRQVFRILGMSVLSNVV